MIQEGFLIKDMDKMDEYKLESILVIIFNISIFFTDIVERYSIIQLICVCLMFLVDIIYSRKKYIGKSLFALFAIAIVYVINIFQGGDLKLIVALLINVLYAIELYGKNKLYIVQYRCMFVFSSTHLLASLFVYFFPVNIVNDVFSVLLNANYRSNYGWRVISGLNPGMCAAIGVNSMYLLICFAVCIISLITSKKYKYFKLFGALASLLMIFTTTKRSSVIIGVGIMFLMYIMLSEYKITTKRVWTFIVFLLASIVIFSFIYNKTNILDNLLDKIVKLSIDGDISNGRVGIWKEAISQIDNNILFGIGLKKIYSIMYYDVHNTYIQLLVETGIVGVVTIVLCFISYLTCSIKNILKLKVRNFKDEKRAIYEKIMLLGIYLLWFLCAYAFVGNVLIDYISISLFVISVVLLNVDVECKE